MSTTEIISAIVRGCYLVGLVWIVMAVLTGVCYLAWCVWPMSDYDKNQAGVRSGYDEGEDLR